MPDITSANATLILVAIALLPVPQQIQGFSTDDIFSTARVKPVETLMGIDGNLSAGFLFTEKPMEIVLMAGSPSNDFFDQVQETQEALVATVLLQGYLSLPSIGYTFQLNNGYLTDYPPIADGKKVLQPRRFGLTWESITRTPISLAG